MPSTQLDDIKLWLEQHHQPAYRIQQIHTAWYTAASWDSVTTLAKPLRQQLADTFPWSSIGLAKVFTSPRDGTKKAVLTLRDGEKIESVLMPNARGKATVCISSQVGCGMACTFCATGTMGLRRNLTSDEIIDQVRWWRWTSPAPISNIVFMGMGEPLANYDAVKVAAQQMISHLAIGATRIVLSTVAATAGLRRLLADKTFPPVRIAISLHAGTDATRRKIVPSHQGTSIRAIRQWTEAYVAQHHNRRHYVTFEYVMLLQVNDLPSEAKALGKEFGHLKDQIKFNLIPWNQTTAALQASSEQRMRAFQSILTQSGLRSTIRYSKGLDITAACGQLVVQSGQSSTMAV